MSKKNIIITIVVAVVAAGAGFFGGIKYGQSPKVLASLSQAQRQQLIASFRGNGGAGGGTFFAGGAGGRRGGAGGGFVAGSVLSKDDKSITVQLPNNGGSKLIFYSPSTTVGKAVSGTLSDVAVGSQIVASGTANSDGSVTAQNIQIRPDMQAGQGAPGNPGQ